MSRVKVGNEHRVFWSLWWLVNLLLLVAVCFTVWMGVHEYSVRRYLNGFSAAILPEAAAPLEKVQAILSWMRFGLPRLEAPDLNRLSAHDPTDTLNYRQLLEVCGSATNAFLNLSSSSGLPARRLLLLTPERNTKQVVAEVDIDGKRVVVDPTFRAILKDGQGKLLTRRDLQDPVIFREASSLIPLYIAEYDYQNFAHVRVSALPFHGFNIREKLDRYFPTWDEYLDWSLLLERRSFLFFFLAFNSMVALLILRLLMASIADHHFQMPRFHLRQNLSRAITTFFSAPEIK